MVFGVPFQKTAVVSYVDGTVPAQVDGVRVGDLERLFTSEIIENVLEISSETPGISPDDLGDLEVS